MQLRADCQGGVPKSEHTARSKVLGGGVRKLTISMQNRLALGLQFQLLLGLA